MVDQAQVAAETNGSASSSPPRAAVRNLTELFYDVITLAELQGQLLALEAGQELRKTLVAAVIILVSLVVALSCIPLAIVCVALALMEYTTLTPFQSLLVTVAGSGMLALGAILAGVTYLRRNVHWLRRSRTEWSLNVRWIRTVLQRLGDTSTRPGSPTTRSTAARM